MEIIIGIAVFVTIYFWYKQDKKEAKWIQEIKEYYFQKECFFKKLPFEAPTLSRDAIENGLKAYIFDAEDAIKFKDILEKHPKIESFTLNFQEMNKTI